ncbi:hypothetical protein BST95_02620 [Halioglobus japonicus]|uniref:Uncharacterized protein n=1 Tax=Halioglobus japonicus TaxID=930805 RepID=A0AAP8MB04_9GAMM|nr:hypothetical protein [Halioglobus japonicus]AQA17280.1 hypothetical protein BST95_02620 [Halioglobus japonicus]PLW84507.1 hypothetical protein C0029_18830 [Halioglobus japonicus]GHD24519.1 hypothetical protein GCM10007052_38150 [Halioglobus japonicus]
MKHQLQFAGLLIGLLCLLGGIADVYLQSTQGDIIQWRVPIILIGAGVGLPLVIFPFFEWNREPDPMLLDEEQYAQANLDGGVITGMSGGSDGSGSESDYSGASDGDGGTD